MIVEITKPNIKPRILKTSPFFAYEALTDFFPWTENIIPGIANKNAQYPAINIKLITKAVIPNPNPTKANTFELVLVSIFESCW